MDEAALVQELRGLKADAEVLKQRIIAQPNRDALQLLLASLRHQITALENRITGLLKSRGNFHSLQVE
jgi:hypothetical protein